MDMGLLNFGKLGDGGLILSINLIFTNTLVSKIGTGFKIL